MDTDQHSVFDAEQNCINEPRPVEIGNKVWIGCRCTILKGSIIPNGSIIAANTVITKSFNDEKSVIGGSPARILKKYATWE